MSKKVCGECGVSKPVSEFYKAHVTVDGEQRYGTDCKVCAKQKAAKSHRDRMKGGEYREKSNRYHREWRRDKGLIKGRTKNIGDMRPCANCKELKPLSEYTYSKKYNRHHAWCKECKRQYRKNWGERNKERIAEYQKGYTPPKKEKPVRILVCGLDSCGKEFEATGPQRYCSKECQSQAAKGRKPKPVHKCRRCGKPETIAPFVEGKGYICAPCWKEYQAEKHQEHKAYYKQKTRERKIRKKNAEGSHTQKQWEALKAKYNDTCLCCGESEPDIQLTRDHVVPLVNGGTDDIDNIQPLCHGCNSKKNATTVDYRKE